MITNGAMVTAKSTGLTKTGGAVRQLATRLERARQSRNEKVARADAEYVDAVRRALAVMPEAGSDQPSPDPVDQPSPDQPSPAL